MSAPVPRSTRVVGVLGGVAGALLTAASGLALLNWLFRPPTDGDKLAVVLTFGVIVGLAWLGVFLSVTLFGISVHAVSDALSKTTGNSALRLAIASVLLLTLLSLAAISDGEAAPIAVALLVLGPITGLNLAAAVLYGRARRAPDDETH